MTDQIDNMPNHSIDYVIAFFGGWVGALTFFFKAHEVNVSINFADLLATIDYVDLFNYTLRSIIGGLIALIIKVAYDAAVSLFKRVFKKQDKKNG